MINSVTDKCLEKIKLHRKTGNKKLTKKDLKLAE